VRYNLDPFNELEDHQLWNALEEVCSQNLVADRELDNTHLIKVCVNRPTSNMHDTLIEHSFTKII